MDVAAVTRESTRSLIFANAVTVVLALVFKWPLGLLLWPYWIQSIVIGYFSRKRMLTLTRFSTEGLRINGQAAAPTEATRKSAANFFALHYGGFHLGYLVFIATRAADLSRWDWAGVALAIVVFSLLKTAADVGMHWAEHRLLQRKQSAVERR